MADSSLTARRTIVKGRRDSNAARVLAMYALYQEGLSLSQVAELFGVSRQAAYDLFKTRNLPLRSKTFKPTIEFNGRLYSERSHGYWAATEGDRRLLHRDVWEFHSGPIPVGCDIHHIDENKGNNDPSNLECLPKPDHTRIHNPAHEIPDKRCAFCGNVLPRKRYANGALETPSRMRRKKFCDSLCSHNWMRGKARGEVA